MWILTSWPSLLYLRVEIWVQSRMSYGASAMQESLGTMPWTWWKSEWLIEIANSNGNSYTRCSFSTIFTRASRTFLHFQYWWLWYRLCTWSADLGWWYFTACHCYWEWRMTLYSGFTVWFFLEWAIPSSVLSLLKFCFALNFWYSLYARGYGSHQCNIKFRSCAVC